MNKINVVLVTLAAVLSCSVFCEQAQAIANPINGSIQFFGDATPSGASPGAPTTITFNGPWHTLNGLGTYAGVPLGVNAAFSNFGFTGDGVGAALSAPPIAPLWSFSSGGVNYSFDLHTLTDGHTTTGSMSFSGTGIAHATGFDDTFASWALQGAGTNFALRISTSTTTAIGAVPEGGTTMALFGIGLAAILFLRRRLGLT
jgi:hypothetical protein